MATVASFNVALIASSGRFIGAISQADRRWMQFARNIQRETRRMPESMRQVTNASLTMARTVAKTFAVVGAVASGAGAWGIRLAAQFEQTRIGFATMLGSMEEADSFLRFLEQRARTTPFGFAQLQQLAQGFLAFGFARREVERMIDPIAAFVAASGRGPEVIESVTRALGQIRTNARLASEEMNQLTEAGVPAWELLSEHIGVSTAQLRDLIRRGLIPANVAIEAIVSGLERRFAGGLEAQANTLLGQWEQVKDAFTIITRGFGQWIVDTTNLTGGLRRLNEVLGRFADLVSERGFIGALREAFPPWLPTAVFALAGAIGGGLVPVIVAALIPALRRLRTAIAVTGLSLRTWVLVGAAVAAIAYLIYRNWGDLPGFARRVWAGMTAPVLLFASLVVRGLAVVQSAIAVLLPFTRSAAERLHSWADSLRAAAASAWGVATSASGLADAAKGAEDLGQAGDEAAKSQLGLGDALEQAAKAARQNLQSFDEVHTLQEEIAGGPAGLDLDLDLGDLAVPPVVGGIGGAFEELAETVGQSANRLASAWQNAVQSISTWWANLKQRAIETFPWLEGVINGVGRAIDWLRERTGGLGPVMENMAGVIALLLVPTLLGMGIAALRAAGNVVLGWTLIGAQALWAVARTIAAAVVIGARWAWMAVVAMANAARMAAAWLVSMGPVGWVILAIGGVAAIVGAAWYQSRRSTETEWGSISATLDRSFAEIAQGSMQTFSDIERSILESWGATELGTDTSWSNIEALLGESWSGLNLDAITQFGAMEDSVLRAWSGIETDTPSTWERIVTWLQQTWNGLKESAANTWAEIRSTASNIWRGIANTVIGWVNHIIEAVNGLIRSLNKLRIEIPKVNIPGIGEIGGGVIGFNIPLIPKIPMLATGGVITGSGLAVVGEAGPELLSLPRGASVTPLSGGGTVEDAVYRAVYSAIRDAARVERIQGGTERAGETRVVLEIDGRQFGSLVLDAGAREAQRRGVRLLMGEA